MGEAPAERRTMRRNIRELPPSAWFLIGGSVINRFGSFVVPFLVLYLRKQGFSIERSGLAVAAYGGGELIAGPLGGMLADRLGRRATIASSMFASAAAMIALSQAHAYTSILGLEIDEGQEDGRHEEEQEGRIRGNAGKAASAADLLRSRHAHPLRQRAQRDQAVHDRRRCVADEQPEE